jgi:tetratricopeptide (TPR) repeat protein
MDFGVGSNKILPVNTQLRISYFNLNRTDEAIQTLEKALMAVSTRLPDNAGVFTRLGLVYEKQSKRDLALKAYKKAYELNPSPELKEAVDRLSKKK